MFHIFGLIPTGHMHTKDVQYAFLVFWGTFDESRLQRAVVCQEKWGIGGGGLGCVSFHWRASTSCKDILHYPHF